MLFGAEEERAMMQNGVGTKRVFSVEFTMQLVDDDLRALEVGDILMLLQTQQENDLEIRVDGKPFGRGEVLTIESPDHMSEEDGFGFRITALAADDIETARA